MPASKTDIQELAKAAKAFSHAHGVPLTYHNKRSTHPIVVKAEMRGDEAVIVMHSDQSADNQKAAAALVAALPKELGARAETENVTLRTKSREQQIVRIPLPAGGAGALRETLDTLTTAKVEENANTLATGVSKLIKDHDLNVQPGDGDRSRNVGKIALPSGNVQVWAMNTGDTNQPVSLTIHSGEEHGPSVKKLGQALSRAGADNIRISLPHMGEKGTSVSVPASNPQEVATFLNKLDKAVGKAPVSATPPKDKDIASLVPKDLKTGGVRVTGGNTSLSAPPRQDGKGTGQSR